jgi:CheY-like chemotaxis protein
MKEPKKILIVDDSRVARLMSGKVIKELYPNIEIIEAGSGEQSIEILENSTADIVFMDINMDGMNGIETTKIILAANPDQKIAVCSANIQSGMQDKVAELGVFFIAKPLLADKLKSFINQA